MRLAFQYVWVIYFLTVSPDFVGLGMGFLGVSDSDVGDDGSFLSSDERSKMFVHVDRSSKVTHGSSDTRPVVRF